MTTCPWASTTFSLERYSRKSQVMVRVLCSVPPPPGPANFAPDFIPAHREGPTDNKAGRSSHARFIPRGVRPARAGGRSSHQEGRAHHAQVLVLDGDADVRGL